MRAPEAMVRLSSGRLVRLERGRGVAQPARRWRWAWLALWLCLPLCAADLVLLWDKNPPGEGVDRYRVYQQIAPATNWAHVATTGYLTNTVTLTNIPSGAVRYYVVAVNARGESEPSNIVTVPGAPSKPGNLTISEILTIEIHITREAKTVQ